MKLLKNKTQRLLMTKLIFSYQKLTTFQNTLLKNVNAFERPGINPKKDLADQYDFTKQTASDESVQRGSTWQTCPGVLIYRRDIASSLWYR